MKRVPVGGSAPDGLAALGGAALLGAGGGALLGQASLDGGGLRAEGDAWGGCEQGFTVTASQGTRQQGAPTGGSATCNECAT